MLSRADILREKLHGLSLPGAGGLVDDHLEPGELIRDLLPGKQVGAGGQNRGFQHGMSSTVESDELPPAPLVDYPAIDPGPRWSGIDRFNGDLPPGTGSFEHGTFHSLCGNVGKLRA